MVTNREYGVPKTEEERAASHEALYGTSELPPRGTGQHQSSVVECAAELIIRALDESMRADEAINLAASTGTNDLKFEQVKPGRELVLHHLSGYDDTSSPTRIRVGYWNGHSYNWLATQPAPLVSETVGINASLHLREGMYAVVRFEGATSGDDLYACLNGYWIKT